MRVKYLLKNIYLILRRLALKILLRPGVTRKINPALIKTIVAIRADRIGDAVVSLPAIKALKDIFPSCSLAVMLKPEILPLLKNIPWIDELLPYRNFFSAIQGLRKRHFDLAIDLLADYSLKTALLVYLSQARFSAGFDIEARGSCFNLALKLAQEKKRLGGQTLEIAKFIAQAAGANQELISDSPPQIYISEEARAFQEKFFAENGIEKSQIVFSMHPFARFLSQCWGRENFSELAARISRKYQAKVIMMASLKEKRRAEKLASLVAVPPVLAVGFSLDKIAALIAGTDVFIGNNSGLLHIAAALNVPTVSTMGPTDAILWQPAGEQHIVVKKGLACSPCNKANCREHSCMKMISIEEMLEAIDGQVKRYCGGKN